MYRLSAGLALVVNTYVTLDEILILSMLQSFSLQNGNNHNI